MDFVTKIEIPVWVISLCLVLFGGFFALIGWFIRELYTVILNNVNTDIAALETMIHVGKEEVDKDRLELKTDLCNKITILKGDIKELYMRTDEIPVLENKIENMHKDIQEIKHKYDKL